VCGSIYLNNSPGGGLTVDGLNLGAHRIGKMGRALSRQTQ
jgi:hypothetical protein